MSFSGGHHGFTEPQITPHIWLTSSQTAKPWAPTTMTTPSVGTINEPERRSFFPRFISFFNSLLLLWKIYAPQLHLLRTFLQDFLEKNTEEFQLYKRHSDNYICSLTPGTSSFQAQYTPGRPSSSSQANEPSHLRYWINQSINQYVSVSGGLFYKGSESNLQYVTSTAFLLLSYAKYLNSNGGSVSCGTSTVTAERLIALAKKQVDYILGDNPAKMSYMVGFGGNYPHHVHHRGSSLPSVREHPDHIACGNGFQYLYSGSPNPNVLVGAIVGGPDSRDSFADDRNNYQQSEPATYINAPFVGALAFFSAN